MNTVPHIFFRLFHREWYETPDRYQPSSELLQVARAVIPPTWRLYRNNKWYYVIPDEISIPKQGWKIHISATPVNCEEVLQAVAATCTERATPFKFTLDRFYVTLTTSKIWPREAAGKFITIYPKDKQDFRELLEVLYLPLQRFTGPYILSDRRFRDSRVIYYRYGGIDDFSVLSYRGEKQHMLVSPDGELVRDQRAPY